MPTLPAPPPAPSPEIVLRLRQAGCVFAEEEARLLIEAAASRDDLEGMVQRRVEGLPLEQVLGWAEFCGLRVVVTPGVFVPRRRTELMVREAVAGARPGAVVLDLCCGSGAVGAAIAARTADVELHAADIERAAVDCARRNVSTGAQVYQGDLFEPLPETLRGRVDVLAANVPYVPSDGVATMPPEARDHEPLVALDGGADGLDVLRRVAAQAPHWLAPGGRLLVEVGGAQLSAAVAAFEASGLAVRVAVDEEIGATVVMGNLW
jgi:release factor glutamine methyltransferase